MKALSILFVTLLPTLSLAADHFELFKRQINNYPSCATNCTDLISLAGKCMPKGITSPEQVTKEVQLQAIQCFCNSQDAAISAYQKCAQVCPQLMQSISSIPTAESIKEGCKNPQQVLANQKSAASSNGKMVRVGAMAVAGLGAAAVML
ncbi:uncharacterized protein VTP21DRAFT_603 [Calcarisporiella thermophila]|uniref:uncharacterized protein n=1 Tax=Calcarisporiella thermophila TaxID=911321 RepID=UPI00374372DA